MHQCIYLYISKCHYLHLGQKRVQHGKSFRNTINAILAGLESYLQWCWQLWYQIIESLSLVFAVLELGE